MKTAQQLDEIAAFAAQQARQDLHPMTCGTDSRHRVLVLDFDENGDRFWRCEDCPYTQPPTWHPTPRSS